MVTVSHAAKGKLLFAITLDFAGMLILNDLVAKGAINLSVEFSRAMISISAALAGTEIAPTIAMQAKTIQIILFTRIFITPFKWDYSKEKVYVV